MSKQQRARMLVQATACVVGLARARARRRWGSRAGIECEVLEARQLLTALTVTPGAPVVEGSGSSITLSSDTPVSMWMVDWGDQTQQRYGGSAGGAAIAQSHTYTAPGSYTVQVQAKDATQTYSAGGVTVTVADVVPVATVTPLGTNSGITGSPYTILLSASDAQPITGWSINWGDGHSDTPDGAAWYATHIYTLGRDYTIHARASDASGTSLQQTLTVHIPLAADPAAPASLSATAISTTQIDLRWANACDNGDGFIIERSPDGQTFAEISRVSAGATGYSATGLTIGTNYWFKVASFNTRGQTYSDIISRATYDVQEPTNLRIVGSSNGQALLSWDDNANNESGYSILRVAPFSGWAVNSVPPNMTSSGVYLTPTFTNYCRVYASGDFNLPRSGFSNTVTITQPASYPWPAPQNVTVTPVSTSSVRVSWSGNWDGVQGFNVYWKRHDSDVLEGYGFIGQQSTASEVLITTTTPHSSGNGEDFSLLPGITYDFIVKVWNNSQTYTSSAPSDLATGSMMSLAVPQNLVAATSAGTVNLTWLAYTDTAADYLEIQRSANGVDYLTLSGGVATSQTSYSDGSVQAGVNYTYRIRARKSIAASSWSNGATAIGAVVPAAPSYACNKIKDFSSVELIWVDNSTTETGFEVQYSTDPTFVANTQTASTAANVNHCVIGGLNRNVAYYFRVRSVCSNLTSDWVGAGSATITPVDLSVGLSEALENVAPGAILFANTADQDTDGIIDRADGFDADGSAAFNADDSANTARFKAVTVTLPAWLDVTRAKVKL